MNKLSRDLEVQVVKCLCNGMSLRSVTRITGVHRTTVMKILSRVGGYCEYLQSEAFQGLELKDIQVDELWCYVLKKQGHLTAKEWEYQKIGDQYLFYAIDRDTKLIPAWALGKRKPWTADEFIYNLKRSLNGHTPQISSDAFTAYLKAIRNHFGNQVDYGVVIKNYDSTTETASRGRYSPPKVSSVSKRVLIGNPNEGRLCTSHIERSNLTVRMFQRRFTRLTNAFSKKWENLKAACALHFAFYNFVWIPRTQQVTPAMAAGVTGKVWSIEDLIP